MSTKIKSTIYVVHVMPNEKHQFGDSREAYKAFKLAVNKGQAALWRGPAPWTKLHDTEYYPPMLKEPFV